MRERERREREREICFSLLGLVFTINLLYQYLLMLLFTACMTGFLLSLLCVNHVRLNVISQEQTRTHTSI